MMTQCLIPASYGLGAAHSTSFCVQDHLASPPRSTLKSSSSEMIHQVDAEHIVNNRSSQLLGIEGLNSVASRIDALTYEDEDLVQMNGASSRSLPYSVLPSNREASSLPEIQDVDETRSAEGFFTTLKRGEHDDPSTHLHAVKSLTVEHSAALLETLPDEPLPTDIFIPIFKKCRKEKDLAHARFLYLHMCKHGFESHGVLQNFLVTIFVESGYLQGAEQLVNRLGDVAEHSWNTLLQGYIEDGESRRALGLYKEMQRQFVPVRRYILMALLKAFASSKCLDEGRELHARIMEEGLENDSFFCNTLMDMYIKCDSLYEAQEVFDEHPFRDLVLWSTIIVGYSEASLFEEVIRSWDQMVSDGLDADAAIFICCLKACAHLKDLDKGRQLHIAIVKQVLEGEVMVGNSLVDMYAKCSLLADSQAVFDELPVRDVVSWTSLIAGYVDHNHSEEALKLFDQMQQAGVSPNDVTFLCILKACGSTGKIAKGLHIHAEIVAEEFEKYPLVGSALVDMYSKFGFFREARYVLKGPPIQNVITWTVLIEAYSEHWLYRKAVKSFQEMQAHGVLPNHVTFLCLLKACGSPKAIDRGRYMHAEIVKRGFEEDLRISSSLVDMYAKCESFEEAQLMFDKLPSQNIVSWTALGGGYAKHGYGEKALDCLKQMKEDGLVPEAINYVYSLKACGDLGNVEEGQRLHQEIVIRCMETSDQVGVALVDMYAKNGLIAEAQALFNSLQSQDMASWLVLMEMYAEHGLCRETLSALNQMQVEGLSPDVTTWTLCSKSCEGNGFMDECRQIHLQIVKVGIEEDPMIGHSVVYMYAAHGSFVDARAVFDKLPNHDEFRWNVLITEFC